VTDFVSAGDGVRIAFEKADSGRPVVFVHGFAASRVITWRNTGWYDWARKNGRSVLALDCRGHGESDKPHEPEAYNDGRMAQDILAVMDATGTESAPIVGYSMGAYLAVALMHLAPERFQSVVLAGVGENYFSFWQERDETIAEALLAEDTAAITGRLAIEFRTFAERAGNDLVALAACMRRERFSFTAEELGAFKQRVLVVCGENDPIAGQAEPFAAHFAHGRSVTIPGRNHHSAVGDKVFKEAVRDFLREDQ
jgi:pimeloyl-ACP methyl ester carboxylesterase